MSGQFFLASTAQRRESFSWLELKSHPVGAAALVLSRFALIERRNDF
jgi:hypothetical protein